MMQGTSAWLKLKLDRKIRPKTFPGCKSVEPTSSHDTQTQKNKHFTFLPFLSHHPNAALRMIQQNYTDTEEKDQQLYNKQ